MNRLTINRLLLSAALASTSVLAACGEPYTQTESVEPPVIEAVSPAVEESTAPARAEAPEAAEPVTPVETLPADQRTSEQTVQPESDTLFY